MSRVGDIEFWLTDAVAVGSFYSLQAQVRLEGSVVAVVPCYARKTEQQLKALPFLVAAAMEKAMQAYMSTTRGLTA